jgi:hypothetical protein
MDAAGITVRKVVVETVRASANASSTTIELERQGRLTNLVVAEGVAVGLAGEVVEVGLNLQAGVGDQSRVNREWVVVIAVLGDPGGDGNTNGEIRDILFLNRNLDGDLGIVAKHTTVELQIANRGKQRSVGGQLGPLAVGDDNGTRRVSASLLITAGDGARPRQVVALRESKRSTRKTELDRFLSVGDLRNGVRG